MAMNVPALKVMFEFYRVTSGKQVPVQKFEAEAICPLNSEASFCPRVYSYNVSESTAPAVLQSKVKKLYEQVGIEPKIGSRQFYLDAWDLRRLYSFSLRRQKDAKKRGQRPRVSSDQFI